MQLEKKIMQKIKKTLKEINITKKEKILVALSGGKDSTLTAYFLKKFGYNVEGIYIDLKIGEYSEKCKKAIKKLCKEYNIPLYIYDMKKEMGSSMCYLRSSIQHKKHNKGLKNCAICGVLKKWILNKQARKLKADKIATGHNLDDEAQTFLMNIFKGSPELSSNIGPITRNISDKKFIPRIKPLFYVLEDDIRKYSKSKNLPIVYDSCPCALDSYRIQVRKFMNTLAEKEKQNIVKNFNKIHKNLKKLKSKKIKYCNVCQEPSRNNICKRCLLVSS